MRSGYLYLGLNVKYILLVGYLEKFYKKPLLLLN